MTEESKRGSWAWKAFRGILKFVGAVLLFMFIWFFDHAEEPLPEIIKKIQNLRFPQDYFIFAIATLVLFWVCSALSAIRSRIKAKRLPQSHDVPGVIHIGKFEIKIENNLLLFNKKGSLKSKSWKERKSEFRGVKLSSKYIVSEDIDYFKYVIDLLYLDQSKTIILCKETFISIEEFILIRKNWKETARTLGLPAVENYQFGSLWREVQDLDKSIRDLAKENKISFNFKRDSHLPPRTKLLQKDEELTIICRRGLLSRKIEIIISPEFLRVGEIIMPFDEMQNIWSLQHSEFDSWKTYYTLVVASNSEVFHIDTLSYDQVSWLGSIILAGACGKLNMPIYLEEIAFS